MERAIGRNTETARAGLANTRRYLRNRSAEKRSWASTHNEVGRSDGEGVTTLATGGQLRINQALASQRCQVAIVTGANG